MGVCGCVLLYAPFDSELLHGINPPLLPLQVNTHCWRESRHLLRWVGNRSMDAVLTYFKQRVLDMVRRLHRVPIVWQGIQDAGALPVEPSFGWRGGGAAALGTAQPSTPLPTALHSSHRAPASVPVPGGASAEKDRSWASTTASVVQPWKCWSGLAVRAAVTGSNAGHPVVMSACWYLDYDEDWSQYLMHD